MNTFEAGPKIREFAPREVLQHDAVNPTQSQGADRPESGLPETEASLGLASDAVIMLDREYRITFFNAAAELVFCRAAREVLGQPIALLIPNWAAETRVHDRLFSSASDATPRPMGGAGVISGLRQNGTAFLIEAAISENEGDKGFLVILRDASKRRGQEGEGSFLHEVREPMRLQSELSAASERQLLEQQLLEISERERRSLAHDLHDGVCQQLSGVALMAATLRDQCERRAKGELALKLTEIGDLIRGAFDQVREVARRLHPVDIDANGLAAALGDLARRHDLAGTIKCRFLCNAPVPIHDNVVAMHLYRIAQEAVSNAIERRNARQILISLGFHEQHVLLSITDDGAGIPEDDEDLPGLDLKLMHHRAKCVGAVLTMENSATGGVVVRCSLPHTR